MCAARRASEINQMLCYSSKRAGFVPTAADVTGSAEPSHSSLVIDGDGLSAELSPNIGTESDQELREIASKQYRSM